MIEPMIEFAFPTAWPTARPKTPVAERKPALWRHEGRRILFDIAVSRLREEVGRVTKPGEPWRMRELTLSTNFALRVDGRPRRDRGVPEDPSAAFFFELDRSPHVLACDRWDSVPDNIAAIAAHIEALRGQERWGVSDMRQAFAGHVALPAPEQWWQVLGVSSDAGREAIARAYRELARSAHPDSGGSDAAMSRLNRARDEGLASNG